MGIWVVNLVSVAVLHFESTQSDFPWQSSEERVENFATYFSAFGEMKIFIESVNIWCGSLLSR